MSFTYRRPQLGEVDDLAALHVQCWQEAYAWLFDAEFLDGLSPAYRASIWRKVILDPETFALVAEVDGKKVGFVMSGLASAGYRHWADGEIHALYLLRAFQGRGAGRYLITAACENWRQRGGAGLVAMVFSENHAACGFYEAMGGHPAGEAEIELGGRGLVERAYTFELLTSDQ